MSLHSSRCLDPATYWRDGWCAPCGLKPGHEVSPNCGFDDDGGLHERSLKPCKPRTYNDGTKPSCSACSSCRVGSEVVSPCTSTADTVCSPITRIKTTLFTITRTTTSQPVSKPDMTLTSFRPPRTSPGGLPTLQHVPTLVCAVLAINVFIILLAFLIHRKWRRGQCIKMCLYRGAAAENHVLSPIPYLVSEDHPEDVLSDKIQSASLQGVLDNLDVLEELVILLDPETPGIKNTKHLASLCSFPSPWVNYVYSMKDSKSPLKAVLERLISSHPDWTVGHLARLLKEIKRNDAIAVLNSGLAPRPGGYF
ncbi:IGF-like family receptor 1 [Cololabis saira]|uniref:IGF-like family receptor 1 n=1 Tax=Cololabis saira TaxID=129043 RepID=UPI002AD39734|nr:IGF-like family receptor 1 [Cololabis saira]